MSLQGRAEIHPLQLQTADSKQQHCSQTNKMEDESGKPIICRNRVKIDDKDSVNTWYSMSSALLQVSLSADSDQPQSFLAQQRLQNQSRRGSSSRTKLNLAPGRSLSSGTLS
ncbi:protein Hook homolog 2-like [Hoplias malabaricus]|uniref:protein Hook homolog 2-like n=1 Tax=Hoplias malabaricus TaxID=27720 RepID=UPI003462538C